MFGIPPMAQFIASVLVSLAVLYFWTENYTRKNYTLQCLITDIVLAFLVIYEITVNYGYGLLILVAARLVYYYRIFVVQKR